MIYRWIGKAAVTYGMAYAKRRYGRQLAIAGIAGGTMVAAGAAAAVYLSSRDVSEG